MNVDLIEKARALGKIVLKDTFLHFIAAGDGAAPVLAAWCEALTKGRVEGAG